MASGFRSLALLGLGVAAMGIHGSTALTGAGERISADAGSSTNASAALAQNGETLAASASLPIGAGVALIDSGQSMAAIATLAPRGFRSFAGMPLNLGTLSIVGVTGNAALFDGRDAAGSSAGNGVLLTSINTTSDYRITATPDLIIGDRIEALSATGGLLSELTINPDGTFTLASGSTITTFSVRVWSIIDQDWGFQAAQVISLTVSVGLQDAREVVQAFAGPVIGATSALVDQNSGVSAAGFMALGFASSLQDSQESLSAAIAAAIASQAALQDANDTAAGAAGLSLAISVSAKDLPELVSSLSGTTQSVIVSSLLDSPDSVAGAVSLPVVISGSIQDQADRIAAAITMPVAISSGLFDLADGTVSVLAVARSADSALKDSEIQLLASSAVAMVANFAGIDAGELLRAGATLLLLEHAGGYVAELVLADRVYPLKLDARIFTLSPNTGKKS